MTPYWLKCKLMCNWLLRLRMGKGKQKGQHDKRCIHWLKEPIMSKSNYIFMMKVSYNSIIVSLVVQKIQIVHFAHYLVQGLSTMLKAQ